MYIELDPYYIDERKVDEIVEILKKGGVIIYPTDTIYGLGCDIFNEKALERVAQIRGMKAKKANFSFVCNDLKHLSNYTLPIDNAIFRLLKNNLPGPYTFILKANSQVPKLFKQNKKTVGIRVPDHEFTQMLVKRLGRPILSASLKNDEDEIGEYWTDPYEIYETFQNQVDAVVSAGAGGHIPSTVVDCTSGDPVVLRQGLGELD